MDQTPVATLYPSASKTTLEQYYLGKNIKDVPAPAAVLDLAPIRRNCKAMLDTARALGFNFRAHVKTHKTIELTRYQMGHESKDIRLVASTISEVEYLAPYLSECKSKGCKINILYGVPIAASHIPRLSAVARELGQGSVGLFIDHPQQIRHLSNLDDSSWPGSIPVFIKIASPVPRAGLSPESPSIGPLVQAIIDTPKVQLAGAYTHMGQSYESGSPAQALEFLIQEIRDLATGADQIRDALPKNTSGQKLTISLGATPTATAAQNALDNTEWDAKFRQYIEQVKSDYDIELHAGVYPVLDMQQIATHARRTTSDDGKPMLSMENIGLRIMAEVASVYDERDQPEALIAAGSIVLGREPCKSYLGWGVVTSWTDKGSPADPSTVYSPEVDEIGWVVGRISQEHGILTWKGPQDDMRTLSVSEKVMIFPNHACMAGPSFGWYFVVDSESSEPDTVREIWIRCRGW